MQDDLFRVSAQKITYKHNYFIMGTTSTKNIVIALPGIMIASAVLAGFGAFAHAQDATLPTTTASSAAQTGSVATDTESLQAMKDKLQARLEELRGYAKVMQSGTDSEGRPIVPEDEADPSYWPQNCVVDREDRPTMEARLAELKRYVEVLRNGGEDDTLPPMNREHFSLDYWPENCQRVQNQATLKLRVSELRKTVEKLRAAGEAGDNQTIAEIMKKSSSMSEQDKADYREGLQAQRESLMERLQMLRNMTDN